MKTKFGQNFLIDKNIAECEIEFADISKDDVILEIGPGKGILTRLLAEKAKKVIAVEIDKHLFDELNGSLPKNIDLVHSDVLKIDFNSLPRFNKIVSNLPFQISSPVTFKLLDYDFDLAVLIYQKEFAERMIAKSGCKNYSRLSVNVYYKARCELLKTVSKTCFDPQPKVDSCIVRVVPRKKPPFIVDNEEFFFGLTKKLFTHRRKKIKTVLSKTYSFNMDKAPFLNDRVEELTPEQIGELSNVLYTMKTSK